MLAVKAAGEKHDSTKFSHASVGYEHPASGEDHCGECKHFIRAKVPRCQIVKNPIRAEDWCRKYER